MWRDNSCHHHHSAHPDATNNTRGRTHNLRAREDEQIPGNSRPLDTGEANQRDDCGEHTHQDRVENDRQSETHSHQASNSRVCTDSESHADDHHDAEMCHSVLEWWPKHWVCR